MSAPTKKHAVVKFFDYLDKALTTEVLVVWGRSEEEHENYAINTLTEDSKIPDGATRAHIEFVSGPVAYSIMAKAAHTKMIERTSRS